MLRSRRDDDSRASNIVKIKIDKYEYWFDLLDLKVYDEDNNEYKISDLLNKPFELDSKIITINNNLDKKISDLNNKTSDDKMELMSNIILLSDTVKALNSEVSKLKSEVYTLQNKLSYL